ncbi:MAG: Panacea domain-containing protein [Candidatus Cryptobacteroides sp.]|jgi:uncharacterized phage-associated protein|nr:Panacea domain-containing protein [Candidatus Cryptobacteroides sp.]
MRLGKDDILVIKAVLLYILTHSNDGQRDIYSLVKTAYYAQQNHLAQYGTPLFKDCICALPFGPVPSNIYNVLKMASGDSNELNYHRSDDMHLASDAINFKSGRYSAKEDPNMDFLSKSDIESLNYGIEKVAKMSFNQIKEDTHGMEWNRAFNSKSSLKEMNLLNIAKEGDASSDALRYLEDFLETDRFARL